MKRVRNADTPNKRVHSLTLDEVVQGLAPKLVSLNLTTPHSIFFTRSTVLDGTVIRDIYRRYDGAVVLGAEGGRLTLKVSRTPAAPLEARRATNAAIIDCESQPGAHLDLVNPEDRKAWAHMAVKLASCVTLNSPPVCARLPDEEVGIQIKVNSLLATDIIDLLDLPFVTAALVYANKTSVVVFVSVGVSGK